MSDANPTDPPGASAERPRRSRRLRWVLVALALLVPSAALLLRALLRDSQRLSRVIVGKAAPPFALPRLSGGAKVSLASLRGRPLVLNFWATWCKPCRAEHRVLLQAARLYGDAVRFVGVVYATDKAAVRRWLKEHGGQAYPILLDGGGVTRASYDVAGLPQSVFIDGKGVVRSRFIGALDLGAVVKRLRPLGQ